MKWASGLKIAIAMALALLAWRIFSGASVSVSVKDEQGSPVPGAEVTAVWYGIRSAGSGWGFGDQKNTSGVTNKRGQCTLSVGGDGGVGVRKEGYYGSGSGEEYHKQFTAPLNFMNHIDVTISMLKKKRPSPMFVRKMRSLEIPELAVPVGFDLMEGDWVAPYGNGRHSDWVVIANQEVRGYHDEDYSLEINFTGSDSGIQMTERPFRGRICELRLPLEAPETGYVDKFEMKEFRHLDGNYRILYNENANYIFRISRPKDDAPGSPQQAMYGKIHGPIEMSPGKTQAMKPTMSFVYYLNPDGTRSLEWDTKKNLAAVREDRVNPEP